MAKYDPLRVKLRKRGTERITMRFADIDALIGGLPASAHEHQAWWANEHDGRHVQAHSWLEAGYKVESVDADRTIVVFKQIA